MTMIDNFDKIRQLLDFRSDDDFYFVQVLQRKKDHSNTNVNGTNNNSRLIKAYYIKSLNHFDFVKPEIIELCKIFGARAGFNLNRRSFYRMAFQHLKKITDQIMNENYSHAAKAYNSVCGTYSGENDKTWIIDVDKKSDSFARELWEIVENIEPFDKKKEITTLPSKNGHHLISRPFNLQKFKAVMSDRFSDTPEVIPEIHKNNPTNLFIP